MSIDSGTVREDYCTTEMKSVYILLKPFPRKCEASFTSDWKTVNVPFSSLPHHSPPFPSNKMCLE